MSAGGLAPTIWRLTRDPIGLDDLVAALVGELGCPEDPLAATLSAVRVMVDEGLLLEEEA